ncbi:glycosyltransferase family 2 protein [Paenibacillus aestuarii]|uniref:Glycosyltransferase family 2 protein n=1 Tax=Paenibacillus aestuarii TaxID=516965 RepID=A0ABW0K1J1_9BACL|nr:glycosyltransferase family 2 protein [Paenibacillus aestuarii]
MENIVEKKVTVIIKTFERPNCLDMLITSIRKYYQKIQIIVADDSMHPNPRSDIEYHVLPFDSGVSFGRNYLIKQVKTPYFLLLDDDFCFIKETKIEKLLETLENSDIDIIGGRCVEKKGLRNSQAVFKKKNKQLICESSPYGRQNGVKLFDMVANFFLARTDRLLHFRWDERLKTGGQHLDFFLSHKGKLKVALHPKIFIYHTNDRTNKLYKRYRTRGRKVFEPMFMKKHGISEIKREQFFQPISAVKKYLSKETMETYF